MLVFKLDQGIRVYGIDKAIVHTFETHCGHSPLG